MDVLLFRGIPVFQCKYFSFPEELEVMNSAPSSIKSQEQMVMDIYKWYEEVLEFLRCIDSMTKEYLAHMDRLRYTTEEKVKSDCGKFLYYFYVHHKDLTDFHTWTGGDIHILYQIFQVLRVHFHHMLIWQTERVDNICREHAQLLEGRYEN